MEKRKISKSPPEKQSGKTPEQRTTNAWDSETDIDWPKRFRETFDLWQKLNPKRYVRMLEVGK